MQNVHLYTGTLERAWKKENSLKHVRIWQLWRRITRRLESRARMALKGRARLNMMKLEDNTMKLEDNTHSCVLSLEAETEN
mmetsp:Transcript_19547/g.31031  ORF Transcript_19547/g.31031 Transcript_19547/m.31031 type:complete len:81 (-) Transcript_19547:145-387(-)